MEEKKIAVLSLSGGLDSTCLLLKLLSVGYTVYAYSFDYGQKHKVELEKLAINIEGLQKGAKLPVYHRIIDLKTCFDESQSSLHQGGEEIPEGYYADENMKSTVVENRNVIFASIIYGKALSISKREDADVDIFLGIHAGDHSIYPDCRPESREACEKAFQVSNWGSERVHYKAPFVDIDKGEVLQQGINAMYEMNFKPSMALNILAHTHTCYNPDAEGRACGKCGSCTERLEAFAAKGMKDPAPYQND